MKRSRQADLEEIAGDDELDPAKRGLVPSQAETGEERWSGQTSEEMIQTADKRCSHGRDLGQLVKQVTIDHRDWQSQTRRGGKRRAHQFEWKLVESSTERRLTLIHDEHLGPRPSRERLLVALHLASPI